MPAPLPAFDSGSTEHPSFLKMRSACPQPRESLAIATVMTLLPADATQLLASGTIVDTSPAGSKRATMFGSR